jgi:hypothetical protein
MESLPLDIEHETHARSPLTMSVWRHLPRIHSTRDVANGRDPLLTFPRGIMSWRCVRRVSPLRNHNVQQLVHERCRSPFIGARAASQYAQTLPNLALKQSTRVMYQGFTGRVSTANAAESIAWGTNIVGGTSRREGEHLGLPLYLSVRKAVEELKPDATAVFVGAKDGQASKAIEEAIDAEIGLVVAVAEFVPLGDMLRVSFRKCGTVGESMQRC